MEFEDVFNKANELIDMLSFVCNDDLIQYVVNEVQSNGYCDNSGYSDYLNNKYLS